MVGCIAIPIIIIEMIFWIVSVGMVYYLFVKFKTFNDNLLGIIWIITIGIIIMSMIISIDMGRFNFIRELVEMIPCIVWVK